MFFDDKKREELHSFFIKKINEKFTPDELKNITSNYDVEGWIKSFIIDVTDLIDDEVDSSITCLLSDMGCELDTEPTDETENDEYNLWENEEKEETEENDTHNHGVDYNEY